MSVLSQRSPLHPIFAAHYSGQAKDQLQHLAVTDLDSAQNIWGGSDSSIAFRNVLVGPTSQRSDTWQSWLSSGIIEYKEQLAFYVLKQTFTINGQTRERWGVICALDLEDTSLIIHEDVVDEGVERARQATEACEGDLAPIFVGYDEILATKIRSYLEQVLVGVPVLLNYQDPSQQSSTHSIWEITGSKQIREIQDLLRGEKLFLLDGHHRLAAARSNWRQGLGDGKILACVCSFAPQDTAILPIHRVVHNSAWILTDRLIEDWTQLGCQIKEIATVQPSHFQEQINQLINGDLCCLMLHAHANKILELRFPSHLEKIPIEERDMAVAHLEYYLSSSFKNATVIPVTDPGFALEQLALEQAQVAIFLPSLRPFQIKRVASAGLRLPRKSTRFVPKPALGLIMRPWR
jgi:uncharacterized protein (DUF1015 family)